MKFEVRHVPGLGRTAVALEEVGVGQVLLDEAPLLTWRDSRGPTLARDVTGPLGPAPGSDPSSDPGGTFGPRTDRHAPDEDATRPLSDLPDTPHSVHTAPTVCPKPYVNSSASFSDPPSASFSGPPSANFSGRPSASFSSPPSDHTATASHVADSGPLSLFEADLLLAYTSSPASIRASIQQDFCCPALDDPHPTVAQALRAARAFLQQAAPKPLTPPEPETGVGPEARPGSESGSESDREWAPPPGREHTAARPSLRPAVPGSESGSESELQRVLLIANVNCHRLSDEGDFGLFVLASKASHSCEPNCVFLPSGDQSESSGPPESVGQSGGILEDPPTTASATESTGDLCRLKIESNDTSRPPRIESNELFRLKIDSNGSRSCQINWPGDHKGRPVDSESDSEHNSSCPPFRLQLRTCRHVLPGDVISISYLGAYPVCKSTSVRRRRLDETWLFRCECPRCKRPDTCRVLLCPGCGREIVPSSDGHVSCSSCGVVYSLEECANNGVTVTPLVDEAAANNSDVSLADGTSSSFESRGENSRPPTFPGLAVENQLAAALDEIYYELSRDATCSDTLRSMMAKAKSAHLSDRHWVVATLHRMLALAYLREGKLGKAIGHLRTFVGWLDRRMWGHAPEAVVEHVFELAGWLWESGCMEEAASLYRKRVEYAAMIWGDDDSRVWEARDRVRVT